MGKSFISEHSAEFVLVPQFSAILSTQYKIVVPIYFWSRREGSNISIKCVPQGMVRVVAMYARRPKVEVPGQKLIEVKFNNILYRRSEYFKHEGIPVFAGVPNASNLMDLQMGIKCSWFYLKGDGLDIEEVACIDIISGEFQGDYVSRPLSADDILDYIRQVSKPMKWSRAIEIIRSAGKSDSHNYIYWRFNTDMYKPIYFLLWDKDK